uniref:NTP-PPase n=1 Tax=Firmicutes phage HS18 TaxID=3056396 RepID=A0AA50ACX6_9VIRU|nr:MAG: NTP-PPase [Firmicutes phage HS18]
MEFKELQEKVLDWANSHDLLHEENADKQFLKFIEEVFEFKTEMDFYSGKSEVLSSVSKNLMKDEMGDIFVTLIILCNQIGIEPQECLELAYEKIKDRKGKTIDGTFVKEEDLPGRVE